MQTSNESEERSPRHRGELDPEEQTHVEEDRYPEQYVCCECGCSKINTRVASTCRKLKERKREREERRRAEEERGRARREAERAERAARDAADLEAARMHVEGSQWAPARKVLDALLKRSPDDFEARLLRIQCLAGAGQLEAAAQEADKVERRLVAVETGVNADSLRRCRVEALRSHVAAEQRRREEAKRRAEEEARRRAQDEQRERERQQREEQERTEARRRELEEEQRREEERLQEERRQAAEAERQREEARWREEAARANEQRRLEEQREARRREQERRLAAGQRRREDPGLQWSQMPQGKGVCRYRPAAAPDREEAECAICFEPLSAGPPPAALPCRHRFEFHGRCIATWRAEKHAAGCPLCGAPFAGPSSSAAAAAAVAGAASSSPTPAPARAERAAGPAAEGLSGASSSSSTPALQPAPGAAGGPASLSSSSPAPPQAPRRPTRPYQPPGISFA
eukprot:tig00000670_g3029.t1